MIETHLLSKQFGTFHAVCNVNLMVRPGEVLALLGPNGAGKTTTVRMLSGILKPTSGTAHIGGHDVVQDAQLVRRKVGLLTEYPGLYNRMNAMEYLQFFGTLFGMSEAASFAQAERLLTQFGLWDARLKRVDSYSKGMKQKVALVRALINNPPILFLDEPTTAMDPQSARQVRDAIGELRAEDRTILLTTHNLPEAEYLADRIAIIRNGQIIAEGTMQQLMQQLLGDPLWELTIASPDERLKPLVAEIAHVETSTLTTVQFRCSEPHHINPILMRHAFEMGLPIISLAEVPRNLEQVYLHIVSNDSIATTHDTTNATATHMATHDVTKMSMEQQQEKRGVL